MVWDRLFRLKQRGVTLILTTHYMDEAEQLCDRLVVMDHGTIAAEGTPRELIDPLLHPRGPRAAVRPGRAGGAAREDQRPVARTDGGDCRPHPALRGRRRRVPRRASTRPGLEPITELVRRSTLEDVFLHLTGRTLVD